MSDLEKLIRATFADGVEHGFQLAILTLQKELINVRAKHPEANEPKPRRKRRK